MTKHVRADISFELPADPAEEVAALAAIAAAWQHFTETARAVPGIKVFGQSLNMKKYQGPRFTGPRIVKSGDAA
jgi:transketolase